MKKLRNIIYFNVLKKKHLKYKNNIKKMILFLWKRYLFSSTKNQRNSQKVLLDLDKRYNKITKNRVNNTISGKNSNYNINSKNFSPSKQRINTHLQKKIQNLDNSIRKKKYFKETLDSIPFYDEKEIQKRIFHSQSGERLFSLYNGHKFTFSIKNIITTFMKYAELTKLSPVNKISLNDKRFISLLYKAEEIIPQANNLERVLLCKISFLSNIYLNLHIND